MPLSDHIFDLVAKNRIPEAITVLRESLPTGGPLLEAVAQSGRYTDLMQRLHAGTLTTEQADVEKNKIRLAVLNLAGLVDEVVADHPELAPPPPSIGTQINQQHSGSGDNVGGDKIITNG
jgi:hypothetical protein